MHAVARFQDAIGRRSLSLTPITLGYILLGFGFDRLFAFLLFVGTLMAKKVTNYFEIKPVAGFKFWIPFRLLDSVSLDGCDFGV